jgi:hypothetical protein
MRENGVIFVDDDDLPLECALWVSNPIENRKPSIEGVYTTLKCNRYDCNN